MELKGRYIILDRELNELDIFALDFLEILKKHTLYVVISGYISILLGRTRATEDIDVYINFLSKEVFLQLYNELDMQGFWCLNVENADEVYSYLYDGLAVRFSRKGNSIPNFEVKFPKDELDNSTFQDSLIVKLPEEKEIIISSLERQIAFKRYFLMSEKDKEDALHVENLFGDSIDYAKVNKFKELIENREKKRK